MKLFILGLIIIAAVTFFAYRKKILENMEDGENSYMDKSQQLYSALAKAGDPDAVNIPSGKPSTVDFIKIQNDLTTTDNYRKIRDAKFEESKVELAIPKGDMTDKLNSCKQITKCSQLNNSDCGYCVYTKEFQYGGSGAPAADVCPSNAWTNDPNKCQQMKEQAVCKEVKSCGDLTGEAAEMCAWCPTSGKAIPFKQAGNKKVPKYPGDACNNAGYGILGAKECQKFLKDHPCLTPTAYSGPHSPSCLSKLWKDAIGGDRRTINWMKYSKNGYWNKRGYPAVLSDMKAWKAYTRSNDYATAVKGGLMCYGRKPDPCKTQFNPKPAECMDQLWKQGGAKSSGTGLPSKAGFYRSGKSSYKTTIGRYRFTLDQAKEACRKDGARLCSKNEIMDKNICSAGWTADGIRGYPMADGGSRGCGGSRKGWRTWSRNPKSKGSAHCCYELNSDNSKSSIINSIKGLANKAISGNSTQQAGLMKMVYGENWTPPPPAKPGDLVELNWKEGSVPSVHRGYVISKMGNKCSIMWTDYKGKATVDRYNIKNDPSGINTQRYWFGWPGIRATVLKGASNVDAGGLVLENHLKVIKTCNNAPSNCDINCRRIIQGLMGKFPTPQDCVVSNWSGWSPCSKKCGEGIQSRSRSVKYPPKHSGLPCPSLNEKRVCEEKPCYPANYKGCYRDCKGRDLPTHAGNMTKAQCADAARKRNNKYYGLQYQNGVGGGSRDKAQCWLGNNYGKQGTRNNCKNLGAQNNIPYGQGCSNAVYENENYKPSKGFTKWERISGGLKNVSSSGNGWIWGVNRSDNIYKRKKNGGSWQRVNGGLKQISGGQNEVWGVNRNNAIYKRPVDGSSNWQRIGGSLKDVSASGNGWVWGVNSGGKIYKRRKNGGNWQGVYGGLKQISGGQKEVWGVNNNDAIYKMPIDGNGKWQNIRGRLKWVSAGHPDYVFGVNANDQIYECKKPCNGNWKKLPGGLKQIDGGKNDIWGVNRNDAIYKSA